MRIVLLPSSAGLLVAVCAVCKSHLEGDPWRCGSCSSLLHTDCAAELGRCPSLGCSRPRIRIGPVYPSIDEVLAGIARRRRRMWLAIGTLAWIAGLALMAIGPLLEPVFLAPALRNREASWAPGLIHTVGRIMEHTGRTDRALELYETEFFFAYRGDETLNPGLRELAERFYSAQDDPSGFASFIPWRIQPYVRQGEPTPGWIGDGAPHPRLARVLLDLARIYEAKRNYIPMRHIERALQHCFEHGVFTDPVVKAELEEQLKRDHPRSY